MMRKPAPLRRGDVVGVIAPAGAVDEPRVRAGIDTLEDAGFRVRLGAAALKKSGYLAGADGERVADIHDMFRTPEIKAIIAARGGYGSGRLLPLLDLAVVRQHPKIFVGHSDVTFLLNAFVQRAGLVTFHGPMANGLPQRPAARNFLCSLLGGDRHGWSQAAQQVIQPGTAEGVLVGGCLSIVVSMLGTPHAIDTRGRLLFLEDVNEKPFRIDRMLTQLRQAGVLDDVAGVIFGEMDGCAAPGNPPVSVCEVIAEAFRAAPYPVAVGLPSGHGVGTLTLPFGIRARLADERLTLLESPLAEQS
jgi:muramoyltetrapeptide carboxypeptidase